MQSNVESQWFKCRSVSRPSAILKTVALKMIAWLERHRLGVDR